MYSFQPQIHLAAGMVACGNSPIGKQSAPKGSSNGPSFVSDYSPDCDVSLEYVAKHANWEFGYKRQNKHCLIALDIKEQINDS